MHAPWPATAQSQDAAPDRPSCLQASQLYLAWEFGGTVPLLHTPLDSWQLVLQHSQLFKWLPGAVDVGPVLPFAVRLQPSLPILLHKYGIRLYVVEA